MATSSQTSTILNRCQRSAKMEDLLREKQQLEQSVRDKDTEIERLQREKRDDMSKIKELEAKFVGLQKSATPTCSPPVEENEQKSSPFAKSPARPLSQEKKQQPTSIFADLPPRPVFQGFDTPVAKPARQTSWPAPATSPQMLPAQQRPTPIGVGPRPETDKPPTSVRPGRRPKGIISPLQPHHQSFTAGQMHLPVSVTPGLFPNVGTPNPSSHAAEASQSLNPPPARGNSYYHGSIFHHVPVPQSALLPPVPSSRPPSFDFNQQIGK